MPFYNQPVYLVKTGQGGSTIAQWNVGGAYFDTFVERIEAAQGLLEGISYNPVIFFSQGINDGIALTDPETWADAVVAHFAAMREYVGGDTPIIMTQFQGMGTGGTAYDAYSALVPDIATAAGNCYYVDVGGAGLRDVNHWNHSGIRQVAGSMFDIAESF